MRDIRTRVTFSGKFIQEIDGLRFSAIASGFACYLNSEYSKVKRRKFPEAGDGMPHEVIHTLRFEVQLFFAISGILVFLFQKAFIILGCSAKALERVMHLCERSRSTSGR